MDRGYYEHRDKTGAFQVPTLSENHVLICSDQLVEEFRNAGENELSFNHRVADVSNICLLNFVSGLMIGLLKYVTP